MGKAVTIIAPPGIHAGVASSTANAVVISPGATDNVVISGLDLRSNNSSTVDTVQITSGRVTIDNCLVRDTRQGIFNESPTGRVYIKNTIITTNAGSGVIAQAGQTLVEHSTIQSGGRT